MEPVTINFEVSTGEFTCVKPEPRKQVARAQKKNSVAGASYTYLYILALCAECGLLVSGVLHPTQYNAVTIRSGSGGRIRVAWWRKH